MGNFRLVGQAFDRRRAERLVGQARRIVLMLPPSLRPAAWALILDPDAPLQIPNGPRLPRLAWHQLLERLDDRAFGSSRTEADRKRVQRAVAYLDPGAPPLLELRSALHRHGEAVGVNASAALVGSWVGSQPSGSWPLIGQVARSTGTGMVLVALSPLPHASFRFDPSPL